MDDWVIISWKTAEYLAVLIGQTNWGDKQRRREACADLGNGMGTRKMESSLQCWDPKEEEDPVSKAVKAEKRAILKFLSSKPGTEELVAGIESGAHYTKKGK
jgi:hypothetical protein